MKLSETIEVLAKIKASKLRKAKKEVMLKENVKKPMQLYTKICKNIECQKEFMTHYKLKVYCNPGCRSIGAFYVSAKNSYLWEYRG